MMQPMEMSVFNSFHPIHFEFVLFCYGEPFFDRSIHISYGMVIGVSGAKARFD